jgi:RimJ/RimL family protein N-acetyltransferase
MAYFHETDRLRIRPFTTGDAEFIIALLNSPGWLEFIGDRKIKTIEQANTYLTDGPMKSYQEHGFGLSMVELKTTSLPIGMCGILKRPGLDHPDIGFAFLPEFNGQGYAFEAATATMLHATDGLRLPCVYAITDLGNHRSIKLIEKIGMTYLDTVILPGAEIGVMRFSIENTPLS